MLSEVVEFVTLLRNARLSPAELQALQEDKLRTLVRHTYEHVPYYRSRFQAAGLSPEDIQTLDDLRYAPVTTKEDLKSAGPERIIAAGVSPSDCVARRTGGTTGKPFDVYRHPREEMTRRLIGFRSLLKIGFRPRDRLCVLGPRHARRPGLHERLGFYRTEYVSSHLVPEEQIRRLRQIQPTVLGFLPTALRAIIHPFDYRLSAIAHPRMVTSGGEAFDEGLKQRLEADLNGVKIFNFYATSEFGEIASECPAHEGLHVNADQLILECLRDDGQPAEPGEAGTIVTTNLYGFTMPFIRYHLGDIAAWTGEPCSCGSPFPLINPPQGRQESMIRLPSGKILSALGVGLIVEPFDGIDQYRLVQENLHDFVLQLVCWRPLSEETRSALKAQLLDYFAEPVRLDVRIVDFIPEEKNKFRKFISKLDEPDLETG